jgi:Cyclin, N-terminal domain
MISYSSATEDAISRLQGMRYQEISAYTIYDYLKSSRTTMYDVDADCRTKMAKWCYQVIDFCKFKRETAQISMSILDRYLSTDEGSIALFDLSLFQLACMTALYTAAKIHEPEVMDPKLVSDLSRGLYTISEIEEMERDMLTAVKWRVNPPTSMAFCLEFMNMIPEEIIDDVIRNKVSELTKAQIERAVCDYKFMTVNASTLAFCSFINSLERLVGDECLVSTVAHILADALGINSISDEVVSVQQRLHKAVIAGCKRQSKRNEDICKEPRREVSRTISPRCVSGL